VTSLDRPSDVTLGAFNRSLPHPPQARRRRRQGLPSEEAPPKGPFLRPRQAHANTMQSKFHTFTGGTKKSASPIHSSHTLGAVEDERARPPAAERQLKIAQFAGECVYFSRAARWFSFFLSLHFSDESAARQAEKPLLLLLLLHPRRRPMCGAKSSESGWLKGWRWRQWRRQRCRQPPAQHSVYMQRGQDLHSRSGRQRDQ
jgi:hypothetical protein